MTDRDDTSRPIGARLSLSAAATLERHLRIVERRMKEAGTYSEKAIDDLRARVDSELAQLGADSESAMLEILERPGTPEDLAHSIGPSGRPPRKTAARITIALLALFPFAVGVPFVFVLLFVFGRKFVDHSPEASGSAEVSQGGALLRRRIFYKETHARISDVRFGRLDGQEVEQLGVLDDRRALFLNSDGSIRSKVLFDDSVYNPRFVDLDSSGNAALLATGGAFQAVTLVDHAGHVVWTRPDPPGSGLPPNYAAAGDVDGDGKAEFVMATNKDIYLMDANGQERWHRGRMGSMRAFIVDLNTKGQRGILHDDMGMGIVVRDKDGEVVAQGATSVGRSFTSVQWPDEHGASYVLVAETDRLRVMDYEV